MPDPRSADVTVGVVVRKTARRLLLPAMLCAGLLRSFAASHEIEHPGILHRDDKCSSCHIDKTEGKSVHSAMVAPCVVCHISETQGDMTSMHLSLPRETICLDCHDEAMAFREHRPAVKGLCVDCHDAHSSSRHMLLRPVYRATRGKPQMVVHRVGK